MKSRITLFVFAALSCCAAAACAQSGTNIGDSPPPLSIAEWVKGKPVDLARDARNKVHVVEFWATWCPPCKMSVPLLTKYQLKYAKDLVIVGVTEPDARGNTPDAIRKFVAEQGDNMDYTVAIDTGKTARAYLSSTGIVGLPHAIVINRDGKVVWQGNPLDPNLDNVLAGVIAGTYDLKAAKVEQEVNKRLGELDLLVQLGQWGIVWEQLVEILKLDPTNEPAMQALIISSEELDNTEAFRSWIRSHIASHRDNSLAMQRLANSLGGICEIRKRFPDLAFEAAKAAYDASSKPDAWTITVYARALYQVGDLDKAIAIQQDAVAIASAQEQGEMKTYLDYYRQCKKVREEQKQ